MGLGKWLKSLFQAEPDIIDDRPLSSSPLPSRMVPKVERLQSPQLSHVKHPNAYHKTVDAILVFLNAAENADFKQEILRDAENFDLVFVIGKLQAVMLKKVSTDGLLWHGRDFGEALLDAMYRLKKTDAPLAEEGDRMDVVLEAVGSNKLGVVTLLRQLADFDTKHAMSIIEDLPAVILQSVPPSKAVSAQKALVEKGAQVSIEPSRME